MLNRTLGHYRIAQQLGEGGMGVVYKAIDLTLGRAVALKIVHERLTQSGEARARLLREAQLAAALNHPNICTIYEVFDAAAQPGDADTPPFAGGPVIALELVDGETLRTALNRVGRFGAKELIDIALQIAEGLAEAHQRRIVHRDLKPHNVLITPAGRIKILDFGLAKAVSESAPTPDATTQMEAITDKWQVGAGVLGTAPYMSPEQVAGRQLDSRSDVFSFGTMLYELATGQRPFRGETSVQVVAKILEADPPALVEERPDLPAEIDRIVRRCLQKSPDDRYNDTRDLSADLRASQDAIRFASGRSAMPASGASSSTGTVATWPSRRVAFVGIAAASAIAVSLFVMTRWPGRSDAGSPPEALSHRQLTFSGESSFPAISPDGAFIAYVRGEPWGETFSTLVPTSTQKVVVQDVAGGGRELEVAECQPCYGVSWSPDGSSLLVSSNIGFRVIPRLGGAGRQLERVGGLGAWSSDGTEIAFGTKDSKLTVFNVTTNLIREIAFPAAVMPPRSMDWSSSHDRLAVVLPVEGTAAGSTVWVVPARGGAPVRGFDDPAAITTIRWSRGGDALYYLRRIDDANELWRIAVSPETGQTTGSATAVMAGIQLGPNFSVAGDGRVLYTRELRYSNLWTAPLGPGPGVSSPAARQITSGTSRDQTPAISPDGTMVAFTRRAGAASDVFVLSIEGGPARRVTFIPSVTGGPSWSPDGKMLAFCGRSQETLIVWRIDAAGGAPVPFPETRCTTSGSEVPIVWAPRREILYQRTGNQNYHVLDPVERRERPLLTEDDTAAGWIFDPRPAPDGTQLAVYWNRSRAKEGLGTYILPFVPGARIGVPRLLHAGFAWPLEWSADAQQLYLYQHAPNPQVLMVPLAGGPTAVLRELSGQRIGLLPSISPDKKTIVFSAHAINSDVWIAEPSSRKIP